MSTLSDGSRGRVCPGAVWKDCAGCGVLFPAVPGQVFCRDCEFDWSPAAGGGR